ncbi:MAG TPA: dUTP diphosphatase [Actinomycetota bacterium]|nr:dUTP diphosphatase [Actinomycetota bacterium]
MQLSIRRLDDALPAPAYAREGDAGLDLFSSQDVVLEPGARALVGSGIAVAIPEGFAGFVHARSGRASREGLALVNAPGLIDSGYRGEIKVALVNLDRTNPITIARGDKIAQLVIQPIVHAVVVEVDGLDATARGEGGFGSTGR